MDENEEKYCSNFEKIFVHHVYENISNQYENLYKIGKIKIVSDDDTDLKSKQQRETSISHKLNNDISSNKTFYNAWPKVKKFISKIDSNSLVADIGCGEGKYLNLNDKVFSIGCDRSNSLCEFALKNQNDCNFSNQILVCDNLALPFRSNLFDAVISIGVIHHFAHSNRRAKAVQELCRILRSGGKLMIYVWAMEQRTRKFNSQDVLVPLISTKHQTDSPPISPKCSSSTDLDQDLSNNLQSNVTNPKKDNENHERKHLNRFSSFQKQTNINQENAPLRTNSLQNKHTNTKSEGSFDLEANNFVDNFKMFFTKKFAIKATAEKESSSCSPTNELSVSLDMKTLERYKKIFEEHKSVLPKDFTIRKFPYSSCQNTFEAFQPETDSNNSLASEKIKSNMLSGANGPENEMNRLDQDKDNTLNKRFYHVFKANELNDLVTVSCPELIITSSYYDHGNWCICATKK